jgi:2-hydroxy-6-oxonona-2,4-dienedioate hydrolase
VPGVAPNKPQFITFGLTSNIAKPMSTSVKQEGEFTYIEQGEGIPLVLLHGLFGGLSNFDHVVEHFSKRCKVIIPQLPLYTLPVLNTNINALSKFVYRFLQHKKINNATLLGNSLGGHVSLVFAHQYPEMVARLVLTGSSGLYENAFGGTTPRKGDKEYLRKKIELTFYDPTLATDDLVEDCYNIVNDRNKLIRILSFAKSAIRHNMAGDLPNMKMDTCLIWGKNDTITPPEVAEEFHRLMPSTELFWIDKCGHAPMMEHPEEFNRLLENWLSKYM